MNNDMGILDTERFGTVWDRVTGTNTAVSPASNTAVSPLSNTARQDAAALRDIMDVEAVSMRECCCLAKRCKGEVARVCAEIACSSRNTIRNLNVQHYIITGQSYSPGSTISPAVSLSDALRKIAQSEQRAGAMLTRLAETTDSPSLARVCLCEAQNCRRRARAAECLLARCMCG